jgi:hypothetical protein
MEDACGALFTSFRRSGPPGVRSGLRGQAAQGEGKSKAQGAEVVDAITGLVD